MKFSFNQYGKEHTFFVGQKVQCIYYHEYPRLYEKDAYSRSWLSCLIDAPFKPVKLGIIVGDAGVHPFWLGKNREEQYLIVKFREYKLPKPIPISCLKDAKKAAKNLEWILYERNAPCDKKEGRTFDTLKKQMNDAFDFEENDYKSISKSKIAMFYIRMQRKFNL